jgi:DnaJ-class molecular chaperone
MKPAEIRALSRMLDRLDYYRLLRVDPDAPNSEVRIAYRRARREFHPDSFLSADPEVRTAVDRIAKRLTESYVVLRDPRRRSSYDESLKQGALRYTPDSEELSREAEQAKLGSTPNGKRFHALAVEEERNGDLSRAMAHMKMALTFEPGNEHFKSKLEELKARWKAVKGDSKSH